MAIVIFRTHQDDQRNRDALAKLRAELPHLKIVVLSYLNEPVAREGVLSDAIVVSADACMALPYPERLSTFDPNDLHSASDLPLLDFFRNNAKEDYYWIIEFDVHYSGNWRDLLDSLSKSRADLLGTTIMRQPDIPEWVHWASLRWQGNALPPHRCIKSFMPFARLSHAALAAVDRLYTEGLTGHCEATWPTACGMQGLKIEDIGGRGSFTPWRWRGKHYSNTPRAAHLCPGTFVFRPAFAREHVEHSRLPPLLWHPVKS